MWFFFLGGEGTYTHKSYLGSVLLQNLLWQRLTICSSCWHTQILEIVQERRKPDYVILIKSDLNFSYFPFFCHMSPYLQQNTSAEERGCVCVCMCVGVWVCGCVCVCGWVCVAGSLAAANVQLSVQWQAVFGRVLLSVWMCVGGCLRHFHFVRLNVLVTGWGQL